MTRKELTCVHEPFGDAFYFGPERLSARYEGDEKARVESGFAGSTYKTVFDRIEREGQEVSWWLFDVSMGYAGKCQTVFLVCHVRAGSDGLGRVEFSASELWGVVLDVCGLT